jgi:hypothetical protein
VIARWGCGDRKVKLIPSRRKRELRVLAERNKRGDDSGAVLILQPQHDFGSRFFVS